MSKRKIRNDLYKELMETIREQSQSIKADEEEIAKINADIAALGNDKPQTLESLVNKRSALETSVSRKSIDLARNLAALNSLDQLKVEKGRNRANVGSNAVNGVIPAIIGAASTLGATYAFIKIEHSDCLSGITAKELVKIILSGLGRNRRS